MIYTLTLNPSLDKTIYIDNLVPNEANRITKEEHYPAGKGIDVSRVLLYLGHESIAMGFIGGYSGEEIEGRLFNEGLNMNFVKIKGETRSNIILKVNKKIDYVLNFPGPEISPIELAELYRKIHNPSKKPTYIVISGSIPQGLNPRILAQLTLLFENHGAKVIVDSSGEPLKEVISATPFMIKPNRNEFCSLIGKELKTEIEFAREGLKLHKKGGIEFIVISLGPKGALGIFEKKVIHIISPKIERKNSVGAGDSLVAGVVASLVEGKDFATALRMGVACGTSAAMNVGSAKPNREDVEQIFKSCKIQKIKL